MNSPEMLRNLADSMVNPGPHTLRWCADEIERLQRINNHLWEALNIIGNYAVNNPDERLAVLASEFKSVRSKYHYEQKDPHGQIDNMG